VTSFVAVACGLSSAALGAAPVEAAPCDAAARPWVRFVLEPRPSVDAVAERVVKHLRAQLAPHLEVCVDGPAKPPLAEVRVTPVTRSSYLISIEAAGDVGRKRVTRTVELQSVPDDARLLTIAISAAELLHASWVELELSKAPPASQAGPEPVKPQVEGRVEASAPAAVRADVGVGFGYEQSLGGLRFYGPHAAGGVALFSRAAVALRVGLLFALPVSAPHGVVRATALSFAAGARFTVTPPQWPAGLDAQAALGGAWVWFSASASSGATALAGNGAAVLAEAGLSGWLTLRGALKLRLELVLLGALHSLMATDTGADVAGIGGVGWASRLTLGAAF
jgi:hypothetical protein